MTDNNNTDTDTALHESTEALVAALIAETSAARGIDLWAVEFRGYSASEWARMTDRNPSGVAANVRRARTEWYDHGDGDEEGAGRVTRNVLVSVEDVGVDE